MSDRHILGALGSVFVGCLLITPTTSLAQTTRGGPSSSGAARRDSIFARERDIQNREMDLRLLRESIKVTTPEMSTEDRKAVVSQIFEDFERIQIVNRELIKVSSSGDAKSYKQMSHLAEDMNKRARRLKTNLGIPGVHQDPNASEKAPEMDATELKASLQTLSSSIKSFVTNPLFKDPRVTDVRHLDNLRRDISTVIELSRGIKKSAAKLSH